MKSKPSPPPPLTPHPPVSPDEETDCGEKRRQGRRDDARYFAGQLSTRVAEDGAHRDGRGDVCDVDGRGDRTAAGERVGTPPR